MRRASNGHAGHLSSKVPASSALTQAVRFAADQQRRFVRELSQFVRIPSISAQPQYAAQVNECAQWLKRHLNHIGLNGTRVINTPGHPLVYAESNQTTGRPTVLIYGHYDVQPPGPEREWRRPAFSPAVVKGRLHGRGSSDDKGQLFCHVKAIECWLATARRLPINVKVLFEGEEEIGSPNLPAFLQRNRHRLRADAVLISDTTIPAINRPALTSGLRGGLAMEIEVNGPKRDLHAGHFGGAVHNPIQVLCEMLAKLHDEEGRIAIPGMYDSVAELSQQERDELQRSGSRDEELMTRAAVRELWGEPEFTGVERTTIRPALTINGIIGGYTGTGNKSIIPAKASTKLSLRLVPEQDPERVERQLREFVQQNAPATISVRLRRLSAALPATIDRHHPVFRAAREAYRFGFGTLPVWLRSGGTIPIVNKFQSALEAPVVLMGFGLPEDRVHGPNESFDLRCFTKGIRTSLRFLQELTETHSPST